MTLILSDRKMDEEIIFKKLKKTVEDEDVFLI
jgi:hypothetical protein